MNVALPLIALIATATLIWFLGSGRFGRAQTQEWIDRFCKWPAVHRTLNEHHGKIRALGHYVEFGGLFLVLFWLYDSLWADGKFVFAPLPAVIIGIICMVAALLDELHQLQSGTRQFRRVDFLHSCCGIALAALLVQCQTLVRGT